MSQYKDEEIVELVLAGEKELFGKLVEKYQQPIFNLMLRCAKDSEEAADLTQDAFIKAFAKLRSFRKDRRFFTWLYSLSLNHLRDWQRKRRRRAARKHLFGHRENSEQNSHNQNVSVESKEEFNWLQEALAKLSLESREILVLRYRHDCSIREVADAFGLSESAVKMRVHRGLEQLRQIMSKE